MLYYSKENINDNNLCFYTWLIMFYLQWTKVGEIPLFVFSLITCPWNKTKHRGSGVPFSDHLVYWNCVITYVFIWKTIYWLSKQTYKIFFSRLYNCFSRQTDVKWLKFNIWHFFCITAICIIFNEAYRIFNLITVGIMFMQHRWHRLNT